MRAENLSTEDIQREKFFGINSINYLNIIEQFLKDPETKQMNIIGPPGSGKTFLIKKCAIFIPLNIFGVSKNNDTFSYTVKQNGFDCVKDEDAVAVVLDDIHYFLDIFRLNELGGEKPNTIDFAKTLCEIVEKHKDKKIIMLSDRQLCDIICPVNSLEERKRLWRNFKPLICTPDDAAFFKRDTGEEYYASGNSRSLTINFRNGKEIFPNSDQITDYKNLEIDVRLHYNMENVPFVFPIISSKHEFAEKIKYCVPSLDDLNKLEKIIINRDSYRGLPIYHCNVTSHHYNNCWQWTDVTTIPIRALEIAYREHGNVQAENFKVSPEVEYFSGIKWYVYKKSELDKLFKKLQNLISGRSAIKCGEDEKDFQRGLILENLKKGR